MHCVLAEEWHGAGAFGRFVVSVAGRHLDKRGWDYSRQPREALEVWSRKTTCGPRTKFPVEARARRFAEPRRPPTPRGPRGASRKFASPTTRTSPVSCSDAGAHGLRGRAGRSSRTRPPLAARGAKGGGTLGGLAKIQAGKAGRRARPTGMSIGGRPEPVQGGVERRGPAYQLTQPRRDANNGAPNDARNTPIGPVMCDRCCRLESLWDAARAMFTAGEDYRHRAAARERAKADEKEDGDAQRRRARRPYEGPAMVAREKNVRSPKLRQNTPADGSAGGVLLGRQWERGSTAFTTLGRPGFPEN